MSFGNNEQPGIIGAYELRKCNDSCERCDACDECEQQTNHLSKSVFTQTTGKMLPWQPDSGGTSSFSVPVEMSHTNAARNGDFKWLVLCSTNFSLFLYLSVPRSLSHICTHLGIKSSGFSREPQFRNPMLNDCFRQYCWFDLPQLWAQLAATHMGMQCSFFLDQYFHLKVLLCMCFFSLFG